MLGHNKIWFKTGVALVGVLLGLSGCKDDIINPIQEPTSGKEIPVVINIANLSNSAPSTYAPAGHQLDAGTNSDQVIESAIVYFFDNAYDCEAVKIADASSLTTTPKLIGPTMIKVGLKHIIVVANYKDIYNNSKFPLPGNPLGLDSLPTMKENVNYARLMRTLTTKLQPPNTNLTSPFLMVGKKDTTFSDPKAESAPDKVNIEVERACAKITLKVFKSYTQSSTMTLKSVTLRRGANQVPLFNWQNPKPPLSTINDITVGPLPNFTNGGTLQHGDGNYVFLTDTIYTYENFCYKDTLQAAQIEIQAEVNGPSNVRTLRFYIADYNYKGFNDTVYSIERNHWYDVKVDVRSPGMDSVKVTVNASPWNMAPIIEDSIGGGFADSVPKPLKFVKYFEDLSQITKADTLRNHSKGGAWLKLKVTKGTQWSLRFKNSDGSVMAKEVGGNLSGWAQSINEAGDDIGYYYYFYRPYKDGNDEPKTGNTVILNVDGKDVRSYPIQPRDTLVFPTNSYILRPKLTGVPSNDTRVYIPLKHVYSYWEDFLGEKIPNLTVATIRYPITGPPVENVSIIDVNRRDSAYVYADARNIKGNAIIDVKSSSGTVYWSYHLWVTEYSPYKAAGQKSYSTPMPMQVKNVFMDRNMGATNNGLTSDAVGFTYQWGRKEPYPDGTTPTPDATALSATDAIKSAIMYPGKIYSGTNYSDINSKNHPMWLTSKDYKGPFDPCPEGWRVPEAVGPVTSPWRDITSGYHQEINGFFHDRLGYYPVLKPTVNWWMSWNGASPNYENGGVLQVTSGGAVNEFLALSKSNAANLAHVRCVVDRKYLMTHPNGGLFGNEAPQLDNQLNK